MEVCMETSWSCWSRFGVEELSTVPEREGVHEFRCVDGAGADNDCEVKK